MGIVVRRYIDILIIITYLYSTCVSSIFGSSIPTSLLIFEIVFSFLLANKVWRQHPCFFIHFLNVLFSLVR